MERFKLDVALTSHQKGVVLAVAQGLSTAQIGYEHGHGEGAARNWVSNMLMYTRAVNRVHLVTWAYESGLLVPRIMLENLDGPHL